MTLSTWARLFLSSKPRFLIKSSYYYALIRRYLKIKKERKTLSSRVKVLNETLLKGDVIHSNISKIFTPDQISEITRTKRRGGARWSNEAITKGLQLKFDCRNTGYNAILDLHMPFPSNRTLTRRLQTIQFLPGILHEVFDFIKLKVSFFQEINFMHRRDVN